MGRVELIGQEVSSILKGHLGEVYTAFEFLAFRGSDIVIHLHGGDIEPGGPRFRPGTLFDLASLTKPLCTTLLIMQLVAKNRLSLDSRVQEVLPWARSTLVGNLPVLSLLNHSSGLPAWRPWGEMLLQQHGVQIAGNSQAREWIVRQLFSISSLGDPAYSDLGFMVLGWVIEELHEEGLDEVCGHLYRGLEIEHLGFFRVRSGKLIRALEGRCVATHCQERDRPPCAVDDDNAFVLGGVAGHAGLFGSGEAIHRVLDGLIASWQGKGPWSPDLVRNFWSYSHRNRTSFVLGFDTPSGSQSQAGAGAPIGTVGHLGFTGTSFWLDPHSGVGSVLLTNRVCLSQANAMIKAIRRKVHGLVWELVR